MDKNLTPSEILRALADGEMLCDDYMIFKLNDECLLAENTMQEDSRFVVWGEGFTSFLNRELYVFTPPEKPKKLSEKFFRDYSDSDFETVTKIEVYNWLKKQEDDQ